MIPLEKLLELEARGAASAPAAFACFDFDSLVCLFADEGYAALAGMPAAALVGLHVDRIVGQGTVERTQFYLDTVKQTRRSVRYAQAARAHDGSGRFYDVSLVPHATDGKPSPDRLYAIITDSTAEHEFARQLRATADRSRRFFESSREGMVFHQGGIITDVNPQILELLGYSASEMIGHNTLDFVPPELHARVRGVIEAGLELTYESVVLTKSGKSLDVEYTIRNLTWNELPQRLILVRDIGERRRAEQRIRFLALYDALTGLPNRSQLDERLDKLIVKARSDHQRFATLFIDLDHLKRVNDSLGHAAGDALLAETAHRLARCCAAASPNDEEAWLARIGGDEFVVTYAIDSVHDAVSFARELVGALRQPIHVEQREFRVSASVGISIYPDHGESAAQLLKNADAAMYLAKNDGRDAIRLFDRTLAEAADAALEIEQSLSVALRDAQLCLYFQPILSADCKRLLGAEALIRWNHPSRGLVLPDEFIRVAEQGPLIEAIGQWTFDEALREVTTWIGLGWHDARISLNLSTQQFRDPNFAESVEAILTSAGVAGKHLELEFTERMLMGDLVQVRRTLSRLQDSGIVLAIDDFGTGFSSLSRLRELPIDHIKIDLSFVADLPESHSALAVATSLLQLGRGLSIGVIAEGVETEAQRDCLALLGCNAMQGFLFARPMSAVDFRAWLARHLSGNAR